MDKQRGLYDKYNVTHADGRPLDGPCFVLRPDRDPAAVAALRAYAAATDNKELAANTYEWVGEPGPLTLKELRTMHGEPVYTKTIGVVGSGRWELPHTDDHWLYLRTACEDYKMTFAELEHSYGKTWLAYKQKPERSTP